MSSRTATAVRRHRLSVVVGAALLAACSTSTPGPDPALTDPATPAAPTTAGGADAAGLETPSPVASASADPTAAPPPLPDLQGLTLETVADGLAGPVFATSPPDDPRLFVLEQAGRVRIVDPEHGLLPDPFLDLTGKVHTASIEQGLLGLAFHPAYPDDPRLFLYHSLSSNDNQIVSYRVGDDPDRALADSAEVVLTIDRHPEKVRHNAGMLAFGPDGLLYASIGDGAQASVNGQDPSTLLGAILRIDVDGGADGAAYAIPEDNPFVDGGGAPEVFWYGLRNPWRFSIDHVERLVYIADVGQEDVEEVNVASLDAAGLNFGWPLREGTRRFYSGTPATELTPPALEVPHSLPACSITGGYVYRGAAIPELEGHYFYADWCLGWIKSLRYHDGEVTDQRDWSDQLPAAMVSSFGVDAEGELHVVDHDAGTISRIVPRR